MKNVVYPKGTLIAPSCDSQLEDVIVSFIRKIGAPQIAHIYPFAHVSEAGQKLCPLTRVQRAHCEEGSSRQYGLIFAEQFIPHQRLAAPLKAEAYHLTAWSTARTDKCRHKYASVQDDSIHLQMIAYMLSRSSAFMA